ncbi:MAG TPA: outer membrane protein assembly factor BamA [Verrucomicrobiota bacterium]|nr:outer membrane protein assembly factor BamA [Verrucomicrobiota bacterium]HNT14337.1 outer membrane protein assembly factor BamA [Verrucomicrobiota bacterium]
MRAVLRLCLLIVCGGWMLPVPAQEAAELPKISRIEIRFAGPATISEAIIRDNLRSRVGEPYRPITVDDDIRNLYKTDLIYNVRVTREKAADGTMILTYVVQANPRLVDIKLAGNAKLKDSAIRKKITSKIGEALNERKLFTDSRAIQELYQKKGYPQTEVKYVLDIDEASGRGTATFEIKESPKIKIRDVEFVGAEAFSQSKLRKVLKGTRRHWLFSWITRNGFFRDEKFADDKELLKEFYRGHGYLDFDLQNVEFVHTATNSMTLRLHVFEGRQYRLGAVTFIGTTMLPTNAVSTDFQAGPAPKDPAELRNWSEAVTLHQDFKMKPGDVFTFKGMAQDAQAIENFYDARGHIDVARGGNLKTRRIPNVETGTMDLQYQIEEGQKSYVEKITIRGNTKTKDKVIRRELAISPGETFDMTRVRLSQQRLQNLEYFSKVDARPEDTDVPNRKNLLVSVEEQRTGKLTFGAGFSSIDSFVAFTEVTQGNFDLFHPPLFTGGGQKFRLQLQAGTRRQDYVLSLTEPWFLDRRLQFGTELYYRRADYQSLDNLYDEVRGGLRLSLSQALPRPLLLDDLFGKGDLIGGVYFNVENTGILLENGIHDDRLVTVPGQPWPVQDGHNAPYAIVREGGYSVLTRVGASLAYDTRNAIRLPNGGQRTELRAEVTTSALGGEKDFYKLELQSMWFFPGPAKGHVLEVGARSGVTDGLRGDSVPFYERYYLGGLYSLRGFRYRAISPREFNTQTGSYFNEPIGGSSYWFGSVEYSIPLIDTETGAGVRLAAFYDIGSVGGNAYSFNSSGYSDNWGFGIRLNIPQLGPLRLDYGIPIHHDQFSNGRGRIQFGVGWQRPF